MGRYLPTGIVKGLGVTGGTMLRTIFPDPKKPIPNPVKGADTVQYPHEKETLLPPLMGIQVHGTRVEGGTLVVSARLSLNMASLTLEQVAGKRLKLLVDMTSQMAAEVRKAVGGGSIQMAAHIARKVH